MFLEIPFQIQLRGPFQLPPTATTISHHGSAVYFPLTLNTRDRKLVKVWWPGQSTTEANHLRHDAVETTFKSVSRLAVVLKL